MLTIEGLARKLGAGKGRKTTAGLPLDFLGCTPPSCWRHLSSRTPALPFCHSTLTASRPHSPTYPRELRTLGDHLRKKRLDLGMLQKEVAKTLGVDKDSVYYWETNRYEPSLRSIPKIVQFLGYVPYDTSSMALGERIVTLRRCLGLSREDLAERLGVDESTLRDWERGKRRPLKRNMEKLNEVLGSLLCTFHD
jgi:transcriptional regulator with XRE-family HTH domain